MNATAQARLIRRWSAYFKGWSQAFGAHELIEDPERELRWLVSKEQLGLILTPSIKRLLYPGLLGHHAETPPTLHLSDTRLTVGALELTPVEAQRALLAKVRGLLDGSADLHLYQTYHLIYPTGTRILTLSTQAPMPLIYRELSPLAVRLEPPADRLRQSG